MKRLFIFLTVLLAAFSAFASSSSGRIGVQVNQAVYLTENGYNAEEIILSVAGSNFFGKNKMFGIGYSAGYGFAFDGLTNFKPVHMNAYALLSFDVSDQVAIEPRIGISDTIFIFNDIISNEVGFSVGCAFEFTLVKHFGISVVADYHMPMVSIYDKSISTVAFDKHVLSWGLALNYLY